MLGAEHGLDHAVSGSVQLTLLGHHGNAVAQDLLGENFILDLFQSNGLALQGAADGGIRSCCVCSSLGSGCSGLILCGGLVLIQEEGQCEGSHNRDHQTNCSPQDVLAVIRVNEHGHASQTGAHGNECLDLHQANEQTADEAGGHNGHHDLLVLQGNTVQSRLGDAEQAGDASGDRGSAQVLVLGLQSNAQAGTALGNVVCQRSRHVQHFKTGVRNRSNCVGDQSLMHAHGDHEGQHGSQQSNGQPAQRVVQSQDHGGQQSTDVVAQRSEDDQCHREADAEAQHGHKEHADGLGAPLVGPLFNKGHENDGQDGREHLAAVSDVLQLDAEEVSTALGSQQSGNIGMDHGSSQSHRHQLVAVELGCSGEGDHDGQVVQSCICHADKHLIGDISATHQAQSAQQHHQSLQNACTCNGGDQRLEDADHVVQNNAADLFFALGGSGSCSLTCVEGAQLEQLIVHFDDIVADDHLTLRAAGNNAHNTGSLFQGCSIRLGGVCQSEAQAGGAVLDLHNVLLAANQTQHVGGSLLVVLHFVLLYLVCGGISLPPGRSGQKKKDPTE